MKKLFVTLATVATAVSAFAEGYQVNSLSTKQIGMGHTGAALHLGAESMFFNPAGMAKMNDRLDISASVTATMPTGKATVNGTTYQTDNDPSTPMNLSVGMRVYDNLAVGVSFYTPYGSNIDWTDNWAGAELNQRVKLSVFTLQPTVAWSPVKNVSIGAGLMLAWGSVDLDKALVSGSSMDAVLATMGSEYRFGTTAPAALNINGKTSLRTGVNIGAMWDIDKHWTIGASWRSQMSMTVKSGRATVNYANEVARGILEPRLNLLHEANFTATMPACWVWNFGVSYRPIQKLVLAFDAQLTGWNKYKSLDIDFLSEQLDAYDQHIEKNYKNSWTYKIGAQYSLTERFDIRCGLMIDTSPVNKTDYNPETPGMTKLEPAVGLSFSPIRNFSIDAALLYVAGLGADGSCKYTDLLLQTQKTFEAHYNVHAFSPSIGVSLKF
jgi:long-chain fatty acid transport protein